MTFIYVSGMGTDSTGAGRTMWARVKGQTENALLEMPFQAYAFRPGFIQPMHGARSSTRTSLASSQPSECTRSEGTASASLASTSFRS